MGNCCAPSSASGKKKVKLYMKSSGIYEIDELFTSVAAPLSTLNDVNDSLSIEPLTKATYTYILNDVILIDGIQGMLYAYSAETDGDLKKLDFAFETSNPYIGVNRGSLSLSLRPISDAWNALATGIETAPDKLKPLPEQLRIAVEECKLIPDKAKDIMSSKGLNPMEMIKIGKSISKNVGRVTSAPSILDETNQILTDMKATMAVLPDKFNEGELEKIKAIGKKAKSENSVTPRDIVTKYWPDLTRVNLTLEHPPPQHK